MRKATAAAEKAMRAHLHALVDAVLLVCPSPSGLFFQFARTENSLCRKPHWIGVQATGGARGENRQVRVQIATLDMFTGARRLYVI